jgi:hypothetical protein
MNCFSRRLLWRWMSRQDPLAGPGPPVKRTVLLVGATSLIWAKTSRMAAFFRLGDLQGVGLPERSRSSPLRLGAEVASMLSTT